MLEPHLGYANVKFPMQGFYNHRSTTERLGRCVLKPCSCLRTPPPPPILNDISSCTPNRFWKNDLEHWGTVVTSMRKRGAFARTDLADKVDYVFYSQTLWNGLKCETIRCRFKRENSSTIR